jgi:carboxypeptidase Taq
VAPTLIRVDADEVTYNLHIVLRSRSSGGCSGASSRWRICRRRETRSRGEQIGLTPAHDGEGCLQDVHWSDGAFGYFRATAWAT